MSRVDIFAEATQEFLAIPIVNVKRLPRRFLQPTANDLERLMRSPVSRVSEGACSIVPRHAQHDGISSDDDYLDHIEGEFEPELVSKVTRWLRSTRRKHGFGSF